MKYLAILLILCACSKSECYECKSKEMQQFYFCDYSEAEIQAVIEYRKTYLHDTMECERVTVNLEK